MTFTKWDDIIIWCYTLYLFFQIHWLTLKFKLWKCNLKVFIFMKNGANNIVGTLKFALFVSTIQHFCEVNIMILIKLNTVSQKLLWAYKIVHWLKEQSLIQLNIYDLIAQDITSVDFLFCKEVDIILIFNLVPIYKIIVFI